MRFDLEIPNTNIDLIYVPEGTPIPNGAIATCFVDVDSRNVSPADMLSMDENVIKNPFAGYNVLEVNGPSFLVNSDKFLITHISKYVISLNSKVPLFYKYTINSRVQEDAVKIFDYYGVLMSEDEYIIDTASIRDGNKFIDVTNIYMNKPNRIMFVEYADTDGVHRGLLSLTPIFTEATWDDLIAGESLPDYKYTISNNTVDTSYNGTIYLMYSYMTSMIRMPVANIDESWYIGILNTSFSSEVAGSKFSYSVPEFYIQNANSASKYRRFVHNRCKKILDGYIQLQAPPSLDKLDNITLFVEDYYSGVTKAVFTTDPVLKNRNFVGTNLTYVYIPAEDRSYDGVIRIPMNLYENDVVFADFSIDEQYYEFRLVDFSTALLSHGGYFSIFMLPNTPDAVASVYVAYIGKLDTRSMTEKLGIQGVGFGNMEEYYKFCEFHGAYHLATIAISANKQRELITVHDARTVGGDIADKYTICKNSSDMFYKDIIERNILLPINDSLLAVFDSKRLRESGIIKLDETNWSIDDRSKLIINQIYKTIQENLDVSTGVTFEFRKDNQIPPSKMISVVNGYISSLIILTASEYGGV